MRCDTVFQPCRKLVVKPSRHIQHVSSGTIHSHTTTTMSTCHRQPCYMFEIFEVFRCVLRTIMRLRC